MYICNCKQIIKSYLSEPRIWKRKRDGKYEAYIKYSDQPRKKYFGTFTSRKEAKKALKDLFNKYQKQIISYEHERGGTHFGFRKVKVDHEEKCTNCGNFALWSGKTPKLRSDKNFYGYENEYYVPISWEE